MQIDHNAMLDGFPADWQWASRERTCSFTLHSQHTGQHYRILLGLPAMPVPAEGYPAVWALDGLASFPVMEAFRSQPARVNDNLAWRQLKSSADGLIVAIAYASGLPFDVNARALDYTPPTHAPTGDLLSPQHGGADAFLLFLIDELRPLITQHFSLNIHQQTLFGFSYGGLFTLYTLSTRPEYFQRYWAASPSLWFGEAQLLQHLPQQLAQCDYARHPVKVQITVGLDEQYPADFASTQVKQKLTTRKMVDHATQFAHHLSELHSPDVQLDFQVLPAHDHHDMLLHGARRVLEFAFASPVQ